MAGKQTRRVVINVTPEQQAAFRLAYARAVGYASQTTQNEILIGYLKEFCEAMDVEWPEFEPEWGGNRHPQKLGDENT